MATPRFATASQLEGRQSRGKWLGVCAGIGDSLYVDPQLVRIVVLICAVFALPITLFAYLLAWFFIYRNREDDWSTNDSDHMHTINRRLDMESSHRSYRSSTGTKSSRRRQREPLYTMLRRIRRQARATERRIRRLESYVTSDEFDLNRELNRMNRTSSD